MRNFYFLQIFNTDVLICSTVGTIWFYCNQFEEVRNRYRLAGVWWNKEIDIVDPDFIVASCYMWNWKQTYDILKEVKKSILNVK